MVQWQPPTMLEALFIQLDVGQKFAAHHDAISDKTILQMAIKNIRKSGMLDTVLRNWALQTIQSSWAEFTFFMYKDEKKTARHGRNNRVRRILRQLPRHHIG